MRKFAALATLAVVTAACGANGSPRSEATGNTASTTPNVAALGSCVRAVSLRGKLYIGAGNPSEPITFGAPIEGGIVPACNDTNLSDEQDTPAALTSIDGVSSDVAVGMGADLYLGPGYLTESPRHPLHAALYSEEPDEIHGFHCETDTRSLTGRVDSTPGFGMLIRLQGLDDPSSTLLRPYDGVVFVDAKTEFDGLDRDGIPYLEEGREVSVAARQCAGDGAGSRKLVVTRMTAAL
jgi:hypothetical protein